MMKEGLIFLFVILMLAGLSDAMGNDTKTIIEIVATDGNFSNLIGEIDAVGLTETLNGEGPFTIFAPTDKAFADVEGLDLIDIDILARILKYHVATSTLMAEDIVNMTSIPTLQGEMLAINVINERVMVDNANVTKKNIVCSNGVVHVIDAVLIPSSAKELMEKELKEEASLEKEIQQQELEDRLEEERLQKIQEKVPPSQMEGLA